MADTALVQLEDDRRHLDRLRSGDDLKVADSRLLASREVVAPLAQGVVATMGPGDPAGHGGG